ncbi:MAG: response regulator, partial [Proteobacteria bacterium]|nr:response regulator [Pseudomonadota bacterium]
MDSKKSILLVEDKYEERMALRDSLRGWGFDVTAVSDGVRGFEKFNAKDYNLVISDLKMPKMDGIGLLTKIREQRNKVPVILISGYGTVESAVEAMRLGAFDFMVKPLSPKLIETVV